MSHIKTEYNGVYVREGTGRKRLRPDGTLLLHRIPDTSGRAWFQNSEGDIFEVSLSDVLF